MSYKYSRNRYDIVKIITRYQIIEYHFHNMSSYFLVLLLKIKCNLFQHINAKIIILTVSTIYLKIMFVIIPFLIIIRIHVN